MIVPKKPLSTIIAKEYSVYCEQTFDEHKFEKFIECDAQYVLDNIKPIEFDFLPGQKVIAVDTETYYTGVKATSLPATVVRRWIQRGSKNIPNDFPFCYSISDGTHSFVVYDTLENGFKEFKKLQPLLADRSITKIGHNLDYDLHMIANTRVDIKGRLYDTMHISKLVRGDAFTHSLFDISKELQNTNIESESYCPTIVTYESMVNQYKSANRITDYRQIPKPLMTQYTAADTWNTIWIFKELYKRIIEGEMLEILDLESQMLLVAYRMERSGVKINKEYEKELIPELTREAQEAEKRIYDTAGCIFNINSTQQLFEVIDRLGYSHLVKRKAPTDAMLAKGIIEGNPSFDKFEMDRLQNEGVPLIADILEYRKAEKLLNTFATKLFTMHDGTNTLHCSINTVEAKTGRFSISNPSMQNMPRRNDTRIRGAFIAPEDYTLYDFDFKSQESIILAHYSRSEYLLDIINQGGDIHKAFASIIYSVPYEEVTKELRNIAKSVEFAIVYGAGPDKVSQMTGLSLEESRMAMKSVLKNAPEIDTFIKTANSVAKSRGYVRTVMNRNVYVEKKREYACVNYVCQGSAAVSTKTRMVLIHKFLKSNKLKTYMVLQVHDSLEQYVHKDEEEYILGWLRWLQTERDLFRVPVTVDVAICKPTWKDKKDIDVEAVQPPQEMLDKMNEYDIWNEGIL